MESVTEQEIVNWRWGYVIVFCKFVVLALSSGTAKSFGVLIPEMVDHLHGSYASIGLVCSLPGSLMLFSSPLISFVLARFNHRVLAMIGGSMSGICIVACAFASNVVVLGVYLALSGIGRGCVFYALTLVLERFFPNRFVLMNTLSLYGLSVGITILPVITERSLEAYGYLGAFVILGAISLNTIACAAAICRPIFREIGGTISKSHQDETLQIQGTEGTGGKREEAAADGEVNRPTGTRIPDAYKEKTVQIMNRPVVGSINEDKDSSALLHKGCGKNNSWTKSCGGNDNRIWPDEKQPLMIIDDDGPDDDDEALEPDQVQNPTSGLCANSSIVNERLYWLSLPAVFWMSYTLNSWVLFLVPHAEQLGICESDAVLLSSVGGFGGCAGLTIAVILLYKKVDMISVFIVVGGVCSTMFFLDGISQTFRSRAVLAFVQGVCMYIQESASMVMLKATLLRECNFSLALSLNYCVFGFGLIFAGFVTGAVFDAIHSYTKIFYGLGCIQVIFTVNVTLVKILLKK